jgi:PHD/YefM family antitoxin component YafN of YafNO toxin-antitoxin module
MISWAKAYKNPEKVLQDAKGGAVILTDKGLPDAILIDYSIYEAIYRRIYELEKELENIQNNPRRDNRCS